jgi:hypothetical protein
VLIANGAISHCRPRKLHTLRASSALSSAVSESIWSGALIWSNVNANKGATPTQGGARLRKNKTTVALT